MMQVYSLTKLGRRLAHNTRYDASKPEWKIIHHLNKMGEATKEQISKYCGLSPDEAIGALAKLRRINVVKEATGVEV